MADAFNFRTRQKNDLFDIIMEEADSADKFSFSPPKRRKPKRDDEPAFSASVKHLPSGARFAIGWYSEDGAGSGPFALSYWPHMQKARGGYRVREWSSVLTHFRGWLNAIFNAEIPDKWEEHERTRLVRPAVSEQYNTPFSTAEVDRIGHSFEASLNEITERQLLTAAQLQELTAFTVAQTQSASHTKRIDWQSTVVEGLIKFGMEKLTGSDAAKHVIEVIASNFQWLNQQIGPTIEKITLLIKGSS